MSYLSFPKVNQNSLFVPCFIIFLFCASNLTFSQNLTNNYSFYQLGIASAILLFFIKNFIYTFATFEEIVQVRKKAVFLVVNVVLQITQFYFLYVALASLGVTSYPEDSTKLFLFAVATFAIQVFLNKNLNINVLSYVYICALVILWIILALQPTFLVQNTEFTLRFYQFIAIVMIVFELIVLLRVSRKFLKQK